VMKFLESTRGKFKRKRRRIGFLFSQINTELKKIYCHAELDEVSLFQVL